MRLIAFMLGLIIANTACASWKSELRERGKLSSKQLDLHEKNYVESGKTKSQDCKMGYTVAADEKTVLSAGAAVKRAGLRAGDQMTFYNGIEYTNFNRMARDGSLVREKVGATVELEFTRNGQAMSISFSCPYSWGEWLKEKRKHTDFMRRGKGKECAYTASDLDRKFGRDRANAYDYYRCSSSNSNQPNFGALFEAGSRYIDWAKYNSESLDSVQQHIFTWINYFERNRQTRFATELSKEWEAANDLSSDLALPRARGKAIAASQGSCFFVSGDGTVVTNHHVVDGRSEFKVIDTSGAQYKAVLEKSDQANDLAVLKVKASNHKYVSFAPFGSLKTGQNIFAVGYPVSAVLGTEPKFTDGVVSSTTGMQNMANMFQMTVPIQPGNSGGPVLNEKGQVVGVVTSTAAVGAFFENTGSLPQNVNWAIKSEYVSLLTGIQGSTASWGSRQDAIDAAIGASCMVKAQ
jgi:S1-C subfamily serine protease